MTTITNCNCCCKENVCKYKDDFAKEASKIVSCINIEITEVNVKCTEFVANSQPTMRGVKND